MPERVPKEPSVNSGLEKGAAGAADGHEYAKDFLIRTERASLAQWVFTSKRYLVV